MWSFEEPFEIREMNGFIRGLLKSTWELDRLAIVIIESCFERDRRASPATYTIVETIFEIRGTCYLKLSQEEYRVRACKPTARRTDHNSVFGAVDMSNWFLEKDKPSSTSNPANGNLRHVE
jgi:hypothetical protein